MSKWLDATLTINRIESALAQQLQGTVLDGINPRMLRTLLELAREDRRHASELAQAIGMAPTGFTQTLDKLATLGYLTRQNDPHDRRAVFIVLTEQGRQIRHVIEAAWLFAEGI